MVGIGYNISIADNVDHYLCVRLMVNGVEQKEFRSISGNIHYHNNHVFQMTPFEPG